VPIRVFRFSHQNLSFQKISHFVKLIFASIKLKAFMFLGKTCFYSLLGIENGVVSAKKMWIIDADTLRKGKLSLHLKYSPNCWL
jgi:hypothetical protein